LSRNDSQTYLKKREFYDTVVTLYGRNTVLEVLQDASLSIHALHLSKSNRVDQQIATMKTVAISRGITIKEHTKEALSRISKNKKQDQGVAIDVIAPSLQQSSNYFKHQDAYRLIALDRIQNPQNLGLIIRSVAASGFDGILLPKKETAPLSALVMKASAGTLFKCNIILCDTLASVLQHEAAASEIITMRADASEELYALKPSKRQIFVLGNEHEGVSEQVARCSSKAVRIAMHHGVESLNVAVTAALIAFAPNLR